MNVKSACLVALGLAVAGVSAARAQYAPAGTGSVGAAPPSLLPAPGVPGVPPVPAGPPTGGPVDGSLTTPLAPRLSDWILGDRACDCCGPAGGDGPICYELYTRTGISFPIDSSFLGRTLKPGWVIEGGGRSLFFRPERDGAWTIDLGLTHMVNAGKHDERKAALLDTIQIDPFGTPTRVPRIRVSTRKLHRTFVNLGGGFEWYLWGMAPGDCGGLTGCGNGGCADGCGGTWRAGFDLGGRWGTANLELNEIRHRTDVIGGFYLAAHSDVEVPCGCCIFSLGGRLVWDYTWSDVLQRQNDADVQSIQLMVTFGVRF